MKYMFKRSLLLSSVALMAAPSFAVCAIEDPNPDAGAGKPLVDCWIYPEDGVEGKIVKIEEGADAPEGYAFQPAPLKTVAEEATALDAANARIAELEGEVESLTEEGNDAENAKLRSVEADRDQLNGKLEEAHKTVGIQEKQIKKLQGEVESLTAEKASLAESVQALQDENDSLKAAAKQGVATGKSEGKAAKAKS